MTGAIRTFSAAVWKKGSVSGGFVEALLDQSAA